MTHLDADPARKPREQRLAEARARFLAGWREILPEADRRDIAAAAKRARIADFGCCHLHSATCEPPSELCCDDCPEVDHPQHPEGVRCVLEIPS